MSLASDFRQILASPLLSKAAAAVLAPKSRGLGRAEPWPNFLQRHCCVLCEPLQLTAFVLVYSGKVTVICG